MKSMKGTNITWFVPEGWKARVGRILGRPVWHPDHSLGSVWIRGYQIAKYLQGMGYNVFCNQSKPFPHVAIFLRRYTEEDVVLAQRLKRRGVKIIIDVVVNYFTVREGNSRNKIGRATKDTVESFHRLVDLADQVWCASPFLHQVASEYHNDVRFVPESVDPEHFNPNVWKGESNPRPLFGWAGYAAKAGELEILKPWITSNRAQLLIISDRPPALSFPHEFRKWRYNTFPKNISRCDLCVAPRRVQNDYDRGHSFFKIGVFMAMGVPALAGPVPSYYLLLGNNQGGAICETVDEWGYHLWHFLKNPELRSRWSFEARQVMKPYLTPYVAEQIDGLIRQLLR